MNAHGKALVKLLQENGYRHQLWEVFADFVELAALSVSNAVDLRQAAARSERYARTIAKYEPADVARFPKMLGELVQALELGADDVLGAAFGELQQGNKHAGQFFTPYELCRLMARITVGDGAAMREQIEHRGFVTVNEPAVGAGAQIIALAEAMREAGINYQQHMHVTAVDVDPRAVHMAYLQFSLLHIPAVVILGNTLSLEVRECWYTPAHGMGLWDRKLARGYALGLRMDGLGDVAPAAPIVVGQLDLFGVAA